MRSDMAKVIVERPRWGSRVPPLRKGYCKYLQSTPVDELPRREPMLGRWMGRDRWLNEHLGPMRRFLRSNVGRPWNKVHQDLCEHVSFDNAVQAHVLAHIYQYVHRYVELHDPATVYSVEPRWRTRKLDEGDMYVCPRTGILKAVRENRHHRPRARIAIDARTVCLRRDNLWWEVRLRNKPDHSGELWDVWLEIAVAQLSDQDCIDAYGGKLISISKRLLTPSETKQIYRTLRQSNRDESRRKPLAPHRST